MTTKKQDNSIPAAKLTLYHKLLDTDPMIERKGKSLPYTSHKGNMFSFLSPGGTLAIRLPENDRKNFLEKYKTTLMESQGVIMKEYVMVPDGLLKKTNELKVYLQISYDYIRSLKPKKTKSKAARPTKSN